VCLGAFDVFLDVVFCSSRRPKSTEASAGKARHIDPRMEIALKMWRQRKIER
jgi:hypothetical protein